MAINDEEPVYWIEEYRCSDDPESWVINFYDGMKLSARNGVHKIAVCYRTLEEARAQHRYRFPPPRLDYRFIPVYNGRYGDPVPLHPEPPKVWEKGKKYRGSVSATFYECVHVYANGDAALLIPSIDRIETKVADVRCNCDEVE